MADFRVKFSIADTASDLVKTINECCGLLNKRHIDIDFYFMWSDRGEYMGEYEVSALSKDDMIEVAETVIGKSSEWLINHYSVNSS